MVLQGLVHMHLLVAPYHLVSPFPNWKSNRPCWTGLGLPNNIILIHCVVRHIATIGIPHGTCACKNIDQLKLRSEHKRNNLDVGDRCPSSMNCNKPAKRFNPCSLRDSKATHQIFWKQPSTFVSDGLMAVCVSRHIWRNKVHARQICVCATLLLLCSLPINRIEWRGGVGFDDVCLTIFSDILMIWILVVFLFTN